MRRLLDPVPLLLGGLAGALAGGIASYAVDGFVDWPLVVAFLVGTLVTSLAVLVALGPSRGFGPPPSIYRPGREWRYAGGRVGIGPFTPPAPSAPVPPPAAQRNEPTAPADEKIVARGGTAPGRRTGPFDRFDVSGKRVLALAQDEAIRFNHNYIGTEHILLGVIREGEGAGARALQALGVELAKCRTALEFIVGRGDSQTQPRDITLSPRSKKVIELAIDESRVLGHQHVTSAHMLLGLVREGEGIASGMIESLGVNLEVLRQKTLELMAPEP